MSGRIENIADTFLKSADREVHIAGNNLMPQFSLLLQAGMGKVMATQTGGGQLCVMELRHPGLGGSGMV